MGRRHLLITGRTGLGGTGSPAQGVVGTSCKAHGEPSSSNNRVHRPGGDGESSPGGGRSLLPGPMGGHLLQRTGRTGPGGTGSPARGVFGVSCKASGGPSSSENRAHRPGGDGESCPGGVRSLLPGQWGAIFFREPGAPAWGGRGVLPRGCSESPARPMGGHLLQRTGRTGPGGTGSPAQGVVGVSCQANGGPSSLENRAHRPGGDGESCPGGVRSLLQGQWGAIFFSGQWNSCNALPHCLGAVDSATPAMRCLTVPEQWAVELLQCTTSLPWGSGQWNSLNALPHCLGAAESATSAMHCLTALGRWAVQLLQYTAALPGGSRQCNSCNAMPHCLGGSGQCNSKLLPRTASLPGGSGRCNFYKARPHCLGAVGSATPAMHCLSALGAVGSGSPAMHCLTAWGQWAVQLLQCTASTPGGSGQCNSCNALPHCPGGSGQRNSCNALPHCLGAVGSGTPAMHCLTALGQWAVKLPQCTTSLPGGSGQWNSCNALPHCLGATGSGPPAMHRLTALGAVGSATPATHYLTAWGQRAWELLQYTAALLGGSGQRISCNALPHWLGGSGQWTSGNTLPHCLGAVSSAAPALLCPTAWGQWTVQLLQRTASLSGGSPRRGSPRSGLEDCHGEVDVLPEPNVERCARCEQEMASKGEGRTRGAALSPWRHESKRERQSAPYGWS